MACKNIPKDVAHKLHVVTLTGSGISRPYWEKRTLKALGLCKRMRTVVLKNTPQVNEQLRTIKSLIKVQPLVIKNPTVDSHVDEVEKGDSITESIKELDLNAAPVFVDVHGQFDVQKYQEYINSFPDDMLDNVISKPVHQSSVTMNHDWYLENDKKVTEKGEKVALYFKKVTWNPKKRNRKLNLTKY